MRGIPVAIVSLPGVGVGIGRALRELTTRGRLLVLDRLRGIADPVKALASVAHRLEKTTSFRPLN